MNPQIARRQRGFSLVVVLVLLIVMSVLGIAVLRSSAMQERMSGSMRDRSLAFQAAEAALVFAQDQLALTPTVDNADNEDWDTLIPSTTHCSSLGVCPTGADPVWQTGPTLGAGNASVPDTPTEYWVEYLGTAPADLGKCSIITGSAPPLDCFRPMFRITSRSRGAGRAEVALQANFIHKLPTL